MFGLSDRKSDNAACRATQFFRQFVARSVRRGVCGRGLRCYLKLTKLFGFKLGGAFSTKSLGVRIACGGCNGA